MTTLGNLGFELESGDVVEFESCWDGSLRASSVTRPDGAIKWARSDCKVISVTRAGKRIFPVETEPDPLARIRELAPVGSRWEYPALDRVETVTGHKMHRYSCGTWTETEPVAVTDAADDEDRVFCTTDIERGCVARLPDAPPDDSDLDGCDPADYEGIRRALMERSSLRAEHDEAAELRLEIRMLEEKLRDERAARERWERRVRVLEARDVAHREIAEGKWDGER